MLRLLTIVVRVAVWEKLAISALYFKHFKLNISQKIENYNKTNKYKEIQARHYYLYIQK